MSLLNGDFVEYSMNVGVGGSQNMRNDISFNTLYVEFDSGTSNPMTISIHNHPVSDGKQLQDLRKLPREENKEHTLVSAMEQACGNLLFNLIENDMETN